MNPDNSFSVFVTLANNKEGMHAAGEKQFYSQFKQQTHRTRCVKILQRISLLYDQEDMPCIRKLYQRDIIFRQISRRVSRSELHDESTCENQLLVT